MKRTIQVSFILVFVSLVLVAVRLSRPTVEANDVAHFLAGMPVSPNSPLEELAASPSWQRHSSVFDSLFQQVEEVQFSKIRAWSRKTLAIRAPTLYYFFSGPDFIYADAFYPTAKTYILSGLEMPGGIPSLDAIKTMGVPVATNSLQVSIRSIMENTFFKTTDMKSELTSTPLQGTTPLLFVFLARAGKVVHDATLVRLTNEGSLRPDDEPSGLEGAHGVKITFSSPEGPEQTLYYFGTNLANDGFNKDGFDKFCARFGSGNALIKSASYHLHDDSFSQIREFILLHGVTILQDDSGIPVTFFDTGWELRAFGLYMRPIRVFPERLYQPKLTELFQRETGSLDFRLGYRARQGISNLLLARRKSSTPPGD